MPLSSQRQRFSIFVSPRNEDFLFYEKVDKQRVQESIPKYGDSHPDHRKYPNHFFAKAVQADEEGQVYYYYYAAKRENQDDYNWEHTTVDHKSATYDQVERTYVTLRSEYDEDSPTLGSAMPLTDSDPFDATDNYVLIKREQARVGESSQQSRKSGATEIDSMFVIERRVYLKRVPITTTAYDKTTGAHVFTTTNLVHRDEIISTKGADAQELFYLRPDNLSYYYQPDSVSRYAVYGATSGVTGFTVAELLADSENLFWEVDEETGSHQTVDQVSEEWFYVSAVQNGEANERRVFVYLTPDQKDYLFYELIDRKNEKAEPANLPAFGDLHPEFTKHKFVAATPNDNTGDFYRYYYASDRLTQNSYNWMHATTDLGGTKYATVQRSYVIPRLTYSESSPALATPMPVTAEDPFASSDEYILLNRQKQPLPSDIGELESIYVSEERTYIKRTPLTRTSYDDTTGYHTFRQTEIVHTSEPPTGQQNTISYLVTNTDDDFWSTDSDTGAHKVVEQLSSEWYAVTSIFDGDKNDRRVFTYVSPDQNDFIFYELVDRKDETAEPENLPAYGDSHPLYTSHKFVAAAPADGAGDFYRYYYAAPRLNQDAYNWTFASTNIGGNRYDSVERSSVVERSAYLDETPAQASAMPISASDPFSEDDDYILVSREKRDLSGELSELSSIFVLDARTYIQRAPITTTSYSKSTGYHTFKTTEIWYKNEIPTGQTRTISDLVADTSDPFWVVDEDTGAHREVEQLSSDWYAVSSVFIGEANDRRVFTYVSPDEKDFIFYELIDRKDEKSEPENLPDYGDSHPSLRNHKFVAAVPADPTGDFYRYYYAANRENQDEYNWDHDTADLGGRKFDIVTSTNIILRSKYSRTSEPDPPSKFSEYVYMSKSQSQVTGSDDILRSLFVVERVQYIRKVTITKQTYDNELGSILTSTVEIYRTGQQPVAEGLDADGFVTEIRQLSADWVSVEKRQVINVGTRGKIREFLTTENTTWPAVLERFVTNAWAKRDGSYRYLVYPDYKRYGYSGPTSVLVEQFWQPEPFQSIGPDAPMIPVPLEVQTPIGVTYRSIPTLHGAQNITGTTGNTDVTWEYLTWNVNFPATDPPDWPDEIVVSDDQRPYRGGYIRQKMTAFRPSTTGESGYASDGGNNIGGPSMLDERLEDVYTESTDTYTVTYRVTSEQTGFSVDRTTTIPAIEYLSGVRKEDETVDRFINEGPIPILPASVVQAAEVGINITGPFYWTNSDDNWTARTGDDIFDYYHVDSIWSAQVLKGPFDDRTVQKPQQAVKDIQSRLLSSNDVDTYSDQVIKMGTFLTDCGLSTQVDNLKTRHGVDGKFYVTNYTSSNYGLYSAVPLKSERNKLIPRPQIEMTPMYEPASDYCIYYPRTTYTSTYGSYTGEAYKCEDLRFHQYFYFYGALATTSSIERRFNPFGSIVPDDRVQRTGRTSAWKTPKVGDPDPDYITQPKYIKYTHTNAPSSSWTPSYTSTTNRSSGSWRNYENDNMVPLRGMYYNVVTPVPSVSGLTLDDLEVYASGVDTWVWAHPVTGDPFIQVSQSETGSITYRQYAYTQGIEGEFSLYSSPEDHLLLLPPEVGGRVTRVVLTLAASDAAVENINNEYIINPSYPEYVNVFDTLDAAGQHFQYNNAQGFIDNLTTLRYVLWEDTQTNT